MKINTIINGSIKLVISAETELEKQILDALFIGPVDAQKLDKLTVGDKHLVDVVVLTPRKLEEPVIAPAPVAKKEEEK